MIACLICMCRVCCLIGRLCVGVIGGLIRYVVDVTHNQRYRCRGGRRRGRRGGRGGDRGDGGGGVRGGDHQGGVERGKTDECADGHQRVRTKETGGGHTHESEVRKWLLRICISLCVVLCVVLCVCCCVIFVCVRVCVAGWLFGLIVACRVECSVMRVGPVRSPQSATELEGEEINQLTDNGTTRTMTDNTSDTKTNRDA